MGKAKSGDPVQFLELLHDYFTDEARWAQGDIEDRRGRRCLVGAIHYLRRRYQVASGAAEDLLLQALPTGYSHLALFNDRCANIAELRALIVDAQALASAVAEHPRERAARLPLGRWWMRLAFKHAPTAPAAGRDEFATTEPDRRAAQRATAVQPSRASTQVVALMGASSPKRRPMSWMPSADQARLVPTGRLRDGPQASVHSELERASSIEARP